MFGSKIRNMQDNNIQDTTKWIPENGDVVKYKLEAETLYTINCVYSGMDASYEATYFCDIVKIKSDKQTNHFNINYKALIYVPNPTNQFDVEATSESNNT